MSGRYSPSSVQRYRMYSSAWFWQRRFGLYGKGSTLHRAKVQRTILGFPMPLALRYTRLYPRRHHLPMAYTKESQSSVLAVPIETKLTSKLGHAEAHISVWTSFRQGLCLQQ